MDEIVALATILLGEYRSGTAFHEEVRRGAEQEQYLGDTTFDVVIAGAGRDLPGLIACLDVVDLAVGAAALAVVYDIELPARGDEIDDGYLRKLAENPPMVLEIVELVGGSFRARVRSRFGNPVVRAVVVAVATVATVALNIAFPPLVVPTLVVTGSAAVLGVSDAVRNQREQQRTAHEIQTLRQEVDELRSDQQELRAQLTRINERYRERAASVVDLEAVRDAQVSDLEVRIDPAA